MSQENLISFLRRKALQWEFTSQAAKVIERYQLDDKLGIQNSQELKYFKATMVLGLLRANTQELREFVNRNEQREDFVGWIARNIYDPEVKLYQQTAQSLDQSRINLFPNNSLPVFLAIDRASNIIASVVTYAELREPRHFDIQREIDFSQYRSELDLARRQQ